MIALLVTLGSEELAVSRFTQMELLAGCRSNQEWSDTQSYIVSKRIIEVTPDTWSDAARLYYDLRRKGLTVRNLIDCCIAQLAIANDLRLIHNDRDYEQIATLRPLNHLRLNLNSVRGPIP